MSLPSGGKYASPVAALTTDLALTELDLQIHPLIIIAQRVPDKLFKALKLYDLKAFSKVAFYDLLEMMRLCRKQQIKAMICGDPSPTEG